MKHSRLTKELNNLPTNSPRKGSQSSSSSDSGSSSSDKEEVRVHVTRKRLSKSYKKQSALMGINFNPTATTENLVSIKFGKVKELKETEISDEVPIVSVKNKIKFEESKTTVVPSVNNTPILL